MPLTRDELERCTKAVIIDCYLREREVAQDAGFNVQLDGEQYRKIIAEKDAEIGRLTAKNEYLQRYYDKAAAALGALGSHVQ